MIILKIMALSILIPMWVFGIARFVSIANSGRMEGWWATTGVIWLTVTGTTSGAIIETML